MKNVSPYTVEHILWTKKHTPKLISFAIRKPENYTFAAGQFSRLGFQKGNEQIWRAYSPISSPQDHELVYYAVLIENGEMSAKLDRLQADDSILLDQNAFGFFTSNRIPAGKKTHYALHRLGHCTVFVDT